MRFGPIPWGLLMSVVGAGVGVAGGVMCDVDGGRVGVAGGVLWVVVESLKEDWKVKVSVSVIKLLR